jgi:hypothetical protein
MLAYGLVCASACSSGDGAVRASTGRFSEVFLSVYGWNGRVAAVVTDRDGRRTGWTPDRQLREIVGCGLGFGSEEGIPLPEGESEDTTAVATPDSVLGDASPDTMPPEPEATPKYHYFHIRNNPITPVGLIDQGGCELRLDPIVAGKVRLGLTATGVGFSACKDTTSVWVRPGVPLRWRLSWKTVGDRCVTKISRVTREEPKGSSRR